MEKHFLADMMEGHGKPGFKAEPWYNPHGDCIVYKMVNEAAVADRIDEWLTMYNSVIDDRPIGFQIKGVHAIIRKFGLDGLTVSWDDDSKAVKDVSIGVLLLAAHEEGPRTLGRRKAYAVAMRFPAEKWSIPANELQPA